MEELTTVGTGLIAAYLSKDGLQKLLGPTADYLGQGLKEFTQKRTENIGRIFQNAEKKLGNKLAFDGEVPPKVLKSIIDEGSYTSDELAVDYLGGILASSRTENGRDDRGASIAKTLNGLSTYQLRTHYLIYSTVKNIFSKSGLSALDGNSGRGKMQIFLPYRSYFAAMDFSKDEKLRLSSIFPHTIFGLHSDGLIEDYLQLGSRDDLIKTYKNASEDGIICQPSTKGIELFLWAFGHADKHINYFFEESFQPMIEGLPIALNGASATKSV
jgi:hypothetical protein